MSRTWTRNWLWFVLVLLVVLSCGVLAQEPQTSPASQSPVFDLSWRSVVFVLLLVLIVFAGLIGYEWVRRRT
jgi:hypothetical protein